MITPVGIWYEVVVVLPGIATDEKHEIYNQLGSAAMAVGSGPSGGTISVGVRAPGEIEAGSSAVILVSNAAHAAGIPLGLVNVRAAEVHEIN